MCWMTIQRDPDGDAVRRAVEVVRGGERASGGHSWGVAMVTDDGLKIHTGLGQIPAGLWSVAEEYDAEVALGHTRFATRGVITEENAHPFPVYDRETDEVVAALAHNGTWYNAPDTDRADSYYIARLVESLYAAGHDIATAVEMAGDITGETLAVLDHEGVGHIYSGRFEITETLDGSAASTGGRPIPTGEVRVV